MLRSFIAVTATSILLSTSAFAGFEWVPPMKNPVPMEQPQSDLPAANNMSDGSDMNAGFPAPNVMAEPLMNDDMMSNDMMDINANNQMPTSILPEPQMMAPRPPEMANESKNLSGKKLFIDPYPLQNNKTSQQVSMENVYKAMSVEAGQLHPVKLGNGMTTGAKNKSATVPKAVRLASTEHKTFLTPTGTGMTPMMGAEPPPLPGMGMPVQRIESKKIYTDAVGFGRDLPLALALSQVIPSDYSHGFADNVDAGVNVSWEGGKPWDEVLQDMLRSQNLTAVIQGNQVVIQQTASL